MTTALPIPRVSFADERASASNLPTSNDASEYVVKAKRAEARHDFGDALSWYQKAADLGDAASMNELGWIYFGAHDISGRKFRDYSKAAIWFQKAADLNYTPAVSQLGVIYNSDGSFGLPADHAKAAQLFQKAAQAGDAKAMNNLGVMFLHGNGVPRDINQAVYWWKKAMEADKNGPNGKAAQSWLNLYGEKR